MSMIVESNYRKKGKHSKHIDTTVKSKISKNKTNKRSPHIPAAQIFFSQIFCNY